MAEIFPQDTDANRPFTGTGKGGGRTFSQEKRGKKSRLAMLGDMENAAAEGKAREKPTADLPPLPVSYNTKKPSRVHGNLASALFFSPGRQTRRVGHLQQRI